MADIHSVIGTDNEQLSLVYEGLTEEFMTDDTYKEKTLDNFFTFLEAHAKANDESAIAADTLLKEY
jgi:hypothetical protein